MIHSDISISVVIPVYNIKDYINRCVDSVLQQTYLPKEIILIDDGSTDGSSDTCDSIAERNEFVRVIHKNNEGVSIARNTGIQNSKGKFVAFLDGDDFWENNYLSSISLLIEKFSTCGIYATGRRSVDMNGTPLSIYKNNGFVTGELPLPQKMSLIITSSIVVPSKVFSSVGYFREHVARGEDIDLWMRIAQKYKVAYINSPLLNYTVSRDNNSSNSAFKSIDSIHRGFPYWEWYSLDFGANQVYLERIIVYKLICNYVYSCIILGEYKEAYQYYKKVKMSRFKIKYTLKLISMLCH